MKRLVALAVGLVLSTLLLGGGWLLSTLRERETRLREEQERLLRIADAVRGAVDESLEELRAREDARPFYLYNHYYSPPDVLAISDPIAVSPLAHAPRDLRLVGHFQIEPGSIVRTPYEAEGVPASALAGRIRQRLQPEVVAMLAPLALGDAGGTMLQPVLPAARPDGLAAREQSYRQLRPSIARVPEIEPRRNGATTGQPQAGALARADGNANPTLGYDLDQFSNMQVQEIALAQSGDTAASARVLERGRQVPRFNRRDVSWEQLEQQQAVQLGGAPRGGPSRAPRQAPPIVREPEPEPAPAYLGNAVQNEAEVDYTPMIYEPIGDTLVLYRVVSHEGASAVQGVLLDRDQLVRAWIPALVERHSVDARPSVVTEAARGASAACALRRPASAIVTGVDLCFGPATLVASTAAIDQELRYQLGGLVVLLLVTLLAAWAIVQAARRAEALSRQKSAFVSAVSHELRTPLTTLRMHAEMLEADMVSDKRRPKVHQEMVRESVRLSRLIDNVLSLSKLEDGRRRLAPAEADLRAHVAEIVEGQRRFVEDRGFALAGPGEGDPVVATFDAQAAEQIVVNLIDNAVKYASGSEPSIEVGVEAPATIVVRDRGPGIPAKEREKVFERFHRVDRPMQAHAPGTGIGLALVKELAEAHGGKASVHPREGGGLEVRVTLGA
ncbi:MAG: HAMP domain-containing histidine kinase [Sandaracinaceae bacterium]|nr:HAMP domain-containing histidine kinase [Sandaracinaceae bacterium]